MVHLNILGGFTSKMNLAYEYYESISLFNQKRELSTILILSHSSLEIGLYRASENGFISLRRLSDCVNGGFQFSNYMLAIRSGASPLPLLPPAYSQLSSFSFSFFHFFFLLYVLLFFINSCEFLISQPPVSPTCSCSSRVRTRFCMGNFIAYFLHWVCIYKYGPLI
jgi:hypothetical protein